MKLYARIKYVEEGELKEHNREDFESYWEAVNFLEKYAVDGIVVTEAHIFYL